jgi:hypothetical protein
VEAFCACLTVALIGIVALIALVLVLLVMPQTWVQRTVSALVAWCGCLGASGLVVSPVDGFCRKFCSEGHDGAVAPVCAEITRRESRTVRPQ